MEWFGGIRKISSEIVIWLWSSFTLFGFSTLVLALSIHFSSKADLIYLHFSWIQEKTSQVILLLRPWRMDNKALMSLRWFFYYVIPPIVKSKTRLESVQVTFFVDAENRFPFFRSVTEPSSTTAKRSRETWSCSTKRASEETRKLLDLKVDVCNRFKIKILKFYLGFIRLWLAFALTLVTHECLYLSWHIN